MIQYQHAQYPVAQKSTHNPFPQVSVLTNHIIKTIDKNKFVWLEKTDGLRTIILIENDIVYNFTKEEKKKIFSINCSFKRILLDTEFYNNKYYIFDCMILDGEDITDKFFIERIKLLKEFMQLNKIDDKFIIKDYYVINSWNEIIKFVNENEVSPFTNNIIDGVICQRIDLPYYVVKKDYTCYKLKRSVMNTIDCWLSYNRTEEYFLLYLYGSHIDYMFNMREIVRKTKYIDINNEANGKKLPKNMLVLFASPYKNNLHIFTPRKEFDKTGYTERNIKEINTLMSDIIKDPLKYNNKIIELSLANDGWVPMRVRSDKKRPNAYFVGISTLGVIEAKISVEESYFTKTFAFNNDIIDIYHKVNHIMRKYIIETNFDKINTVVDLAGGRGADELSLYHSGVSNIFAVDADIDALVQYVNRTMSTPTITWKPLLSQDKKNKKGILLNAIKYSLSTNNKDLFHEIKNREEFNGVDCVLMNYAIHYLCDDINKIKALNELVKALLRRDGLFIFTYFNGDEIIANAKNNELKLNSFTIKLINETIAQMPLPTIDSSGYREEPLVTDEMLNNINMKLVLCYRLYDKCKTFIDKLPNNELVIDYLKFIYVRIYSNR